ncbi:MAG: sigma-54 dependent transcriptional regulator [Polyangia bacterium]
MGPDVETHTAPLAEAAARILIVDDELPVLQAVRGVIEQMGHQAREANDGAQAIAALESEAFDLVVTDLRMPNQDGFAVVRRARELPAHTPAVVLTASASIADCVEAMQAGAFNFLVKPLDRDELRKVVSSALLAARPHSHSADEAQPGAGQPQAALIGESPVLRRCLDIVDNVAPTDATVLLLGESGTGKEVVARLIHAFSSRAAGPFVAVDCAALPEALAESELFGQAKTGASEGQPGRFVEADGGTLLLDDVTALPFAVQGKLLRVLQDRAVKPMGDARIRQVNTRVLAATNQDPEALVREGKFRADLFFRLNVVPITLPALRERTEDVPRLAEHFLALACRHTGKNVKFSEAALVTLQLYDWPGNVRELENTIERLVILSASDTIGVVDLPDQVRTPSARLAAVAAAATGTPGDHIDLAATLSRIEATLIARAMKAANGNKTRAAEALGLNRTTLIDKLKRVGTDPPD